MATKSKSKRTTKDGFPDKRDYGPEGKKMITEARERVKKEKKEAVLKSLASQLSGMKGA